MHRLSGSLLVALVTVAVSNSVTFAQIVQSEANFRMINIRSERNPNWEAISPYRDKSAAHGGRWIELITQQPKEYVNSTIHTIRTDVWLDVYPRVTGKFRIVSTRTIVDSQGRVIGYQRTWRLDYPQAIPSTRLYYQYSAYLYDHWFNPRPYSGFDVIRLFQ